MAWLPASVGIVILLGHMIGIRRMVLVSLCGVSDLFNIMPDYSNGVWFRETMQLILSDNTRDLIMR
jgi:hypothetical protein